MCAGVCVWVVGLHIDWFHHKEEGNTNLLCRILKVQQGLRGALEEESQLVLLGGCLPLALRRWCSVKHFGKHSGTRRQHSLQWREKESDCRSRMMMLRRLRSDLIPAHAHAHTERHTRTHTGTYLDSTDGLTGVANEEGNVTQLGHGGQELHVLGESCFVLERR